MPIRAPRRRVRTLLAVLLSFLAAAAAHADECSPGLEALALGTYYGECVGYCETTLTVTAESTTFERIASPDSERSDTRVTRPTAAADWQRLREQVDVSRWQGYKPIVGCPDCRDQGAEWIELRCPPLRRRITLSAGADFEPLQGLLDTLREIRSTFPRR